MDTAQNRKYAIYSRKSKFTGKGESIENQIELCRQYIRLNYGQVNPEDILVFEDEGFSGGNVNRPQFQKMMSLVQSGQIRAVVCYKLDRISRSVADFSVMYQTFADNGVDFFSASERYDTSTPSGKAMLSMCVVFAQMERETIAERIRDNMQELAKSGRWLGGTAPTGYRSEELVGSVTLDGKIRKAYRLKVIPDEAGLVKLVFSKFLETGSLTKTETYLLQNHIQTKNGNDFSRFAIRGILKNPVYLAADQTAWSYFSNLGVEICAGQAEFNGAHGVMAYNKTLQKSGKAHQMREYGEWIVAVGKHRPLVSSGDWVRAQELLEQNRSKSYRKPKSASALLSGLLFCGNCGSYMRPKLSQRKNKRGERVYNYLCETKEKSRMQNCSICNPNGNELDRAVCEEIKKLSEDRAAYVKGMENAFRAANREGNGGQVQTLKKSLQANQKEIKALVGALASAKDSAAHGYILQQINELDQKSLQIQSRMDQLQRAAQKKLLPAGELQSALDVVTDFGCCFDAMGMELKRKALRALIRRVEWDGQTAQVYLSGPVT